MKLGEVKRSWEEAQNAKTRFDAQNTTIAGKLAARVDVMEKLVQALQAFEELEGVKVDLQISERKPVKPVGKVEVIA